MCVLEVLKLQEAIQQENRNKKGRFPPELLGTSDYLRTLLLPPVEENKPRDGRY